MRKASKVPLNPIRMSIRCGPRHRIWVIKTHKVSEGATMHQAPNITRDELKNDDQCNEQSNEQTSRDTSAPMH